MISIADIISALWSLGKIWVLALIMGWFGAWIISKIKLKDDAHTRNVAVNYTYFGYFSLDVQYNEDRNVYVVSGIFSWLAALHRGLCSLGVMLVIIGNITALCYLSVALVSTFLRFRWIVTNSTSIENHGHELQRESNVNGAVSVVPFIPGISVPLDQFIPYFVGIFISTVIHEIGHAFMACIELIPLQGWGLYFYCFVPAAYVVVDSKELKERSLWTQLQVMSGGVAANVLLALICLYLVKLLPWLFLAIGYERVPGVSIINVDAAKASYLFGSTGLQVKNQIENFQPNIGGMTYSTTGMTNHLHVGTIVTAINDMPVTSIESYAMAILAGSSQIQLLGPIVYGELERQYQGSTESMSINNARRLDDKRRRGTGQVVLNQGICLKRRAMYQNTQIILPRNSSLNCCSSVLNTGIVSNVAASRANEQSHHSSKQCFAHIPSILDEAPNNMERGNSTAFQKLTLTPNISHGAAHLACIGFPAVLRQNHGMPESKLIEIGGRYLRGYSPSNHSMAHAKRSNRLYGLATHHLQYCKNDDDCSAGAESSQQADEFGLLNLTSHICVHPLTLLPKMVWYFSVRNKLHQQSITPKPEDMDTNTVISIVASLQDLVGKSTDDSFLRVSDYQSFRVRLLSSEQIQNQLIKGSQAISPSTYVLGLIAKTLDLLPDTFRMCLIICTKVSLSIAMLNSLPVFGLDGQHVFNLLCIWMFSRQRGRTISNFTSLLATILFVALIASSILNYTLQAIFI